jgi:hypothetical protein
MCCLRTRTVPAPSGARTPKSPPKTAEVRPTRTPPSMQSGRIKLYVHTTIFLALPQGVGLCFGIKGCGGVPANLTPPNRERHRFPCPPSAYSMLPRPTARQLRPRLYPPRRSRSPLSRVRGHPPCVQSPHPTRPRQRGHPPALAPSPTPNRSRQSNPHKRRPAIGSEP